jgi:hypothetical protein
VLSGTWVTGYSEHIGKAASRGHRNTSANLA